MKRILLAVATLLAVTSLAACGDDGDSGSGGSGSRKLTIFAASSLTATFTTLKAQFERDHPDVDVVLSFASSTTLAEQITQGAPADLIATADEKSISSPADAGLLAADPVQFATNTLVIAVPSGNPGNVTDLNNLSSTDFVMCDVSAPCGAAGTQMLQNAGITAQPKAFFPDVATVLTQIELGEADAGIVYVTDAKAAGPKVDTVSIPAADNVTNDYYIAAVKEAKQAALAQAWLSLVTSQAGQSVLREAGFGAP